jgi:UDP-glucuronate 4-epimerase
MSKTVLVTGASGFIGSHLVDALLVSADKVIGIDLFNDFYDLDTKIANSSHIFGKEELLKLAKSIESPYKHLGKLAELEAKYHEGSKEPAFLEKGDYKLYALDLCNYNQLAKVFADNKITHIVHLAALAGVRPSTQYPTLYRANNGMSTVNILDLGKDHGVKKFVLASSSSVYGSRSTVPFREDEDISKPISPYAATKVADEAMAHSYFNLYKIPTVCLRFFTVYGPRQRPDLAIHKFAKLISQDKAIEVYGDGSAKRDFTYIDDIIDGVLKSIDIDCHFEIFNLGESRTTDVNALIKMLEERIGKKANIKYLPPIPGDVPITYADVSKAKSVLSYNPQTQIEAGLDKFVEWFKNKNETIY